MTGRLLDIQFRENDTQDAHFRKLRALVEEVGRLSRQRGTTTATGGTYVLESVGTGVGIDVSTDQESDPRVHRLATLNAGDNITIEATEGGIVISGSAGTEFATNAETDAGVITDKAVQPAGGAYAYDRLRHAGQHEAGKGTAAVTLVPDTGVVTIDGNLSNVFEITLTENVTFADPINLKNGQTYNVVITQDGTGGRTATFGTAWTFTNRIDPVLSTAANAVDMLSCQWQPSSGKVRATLLPDFGAGYTPPPTPGFEDFDHINVGGGNEVFRDVVGTDINFRTIVGGGDIDVTTDGDTIVVAYTAPAIADLSEVPFTIFGTVDDYPSLPNIRTLQAGSGISLDSSASGILQIASTQTGIPAGGTLGQVLTKLSDTDYDAEWVDPTGGEGGGVVVGDYLELDGGDVLGPVTFNDYIAGGNASGDVFTDHVEVLLHFDGADASTTITDETGRTWTANGNAQLDTAQSKFGGASLYLDGTGDWVETPHAAALSIGSQDFCVEAWIRPTGPAKTKMIANKRPSSGAWDFSFSVASDNRLVCSTWGDVDVSATSEPGAIVDDTWQHVAAVRNGGTLTVYINGTAAGSVAISGAADASTAVLRVGRDGYDSSRDFHGWIDEFRFTVGVPRYTQDFVPAGEAFSLGLPGLIVEGDLSVVGGISSGGTPVSLNGHTHTLNSSLTDVDTTGRADGSALIWSSTQNEWVAGPQGGDPSYASCILMWNCDGTDGATSATEQSTIRASASFAGNAQLDTAQKKFGTASLLLDGNSDWVSFADIDDYSLGNGDFTMEAWVRFNALPSASSSNGHCIAGHYRNTGDQRAWWWQFTTANQLAFNYNSNGTSGAAVNSACSDTPALSTGVWYHVAIVRDSGTLKHFFNGALLTASNTNISTTSIHNSTAQLRIGMLQSDGFESTEGRYFNGWIDSIRITKGVARYTGAFTPPTEAFPAYASLVSLSELSDVNLTGLADGDTLVWDSAAEEWVPGTPAGGGDVSTDALWDAAGDLVVGTGANTAARLAAGAEGQVLTIVGGVPAWATPAGGGSGGDGALQFVGEAEVTGSAATTLTLSGLDLDADETYIVEIEGDNGSGSSANISLYFNADTTDTNYDRQTFAHDGSTTGSTRANTALLLVAAAGGVFSASGNLTNDFDSKARFMFEALVNSTTAMLSRHGGIRYRLTNNITSIQITSSVASALSIGTRIRVWKMVAPTAIGQELSAYQTVDFSLTSNVSFTADEAVLTLQAGTYHIKSEYFGTSHVTPDMQIGLDFTGTATFVGVTSRIRAAAATSTAVLTALPINSESTTDTSWYNVIGTLTVTVAGNLRIVIRQQTSSATAVVLRAGSYIKATRLA